MIGGKNENVVEDIQGTAKVSVPLRYRPVSGIAISVCNFLSNPTSSLGLFCVCFFCFDAYVF